MRIRFLLIPVLLILSSSEFAFAASFQPWSEEVFVQIEKEYGLQAEKRMRSLHTLVVENQNKSIDEKLRLVNDTMNNLPWIADKKHWNKADYWATPMETLATFGGDCEDIAIAKWMMLLHLGIPNEKLRLVYVKVKATGENHMILAYVDRVDLPREKRLDSTWILDNIDKRLLKATERKDLLAIYATDDKGNMVVFKDSDKGLTILTVREKTKMQKLEDVKKKIQTNMAKVQAINEGRPLPAK
jgi:predicted transglutaminase-like cysteine proteinase